MEIVYKSIKLLSLLFFGNGNRVMLMWRVARRGASDNAYIVRSLPVYGCP
jgi:hypothetical protein